MKKQKNVPFSFAFNHQLANNKKSFFHFLAVDSDWDYWRWISFLYYFPGNGKIFFCSLESGGWKFLYWDFYFTFSLLQLSWKERGLNYKDSQKGICLRERASMEQQTKLNWWWWKYFSHKFALSKRGNKKKILDSTRFIYDSR